MVTLLDVLTPGGDVCGVMMSYLVPLAAQSLLAISKAWRAQSYPARELVFRPPVGLQDGQVRDAAFERRLSQSRVSQRLVLRQLGQVTPDAVARARR